MSHGQIITTLVLVCPEHNDSIGPSPVDTNPAPPPVGSAACLAAAALLGLPPAEVCGEEDQDAIVPEVTDGLVAEAFHRLPLPPSQLTIQPPGGRTLVNFETNFFTRSDQTLNRTVRLLGQRVDLRIEAHSYTWHFDDGNAITTSKPGAPYPRLQITHNYLQTGKYGPALDTTWVADYRVNGGSWRPVPGSVTIAGTPTNLRAIEARPTLVGY